MARKYVDALDLADSLEALSEGGQVKGVLATSFYDIARFIREEAPAADVLAPVRCRQCRHWCYGHCNLLKIGMDSQDYCSYGKERDDGKEP